MNKHNREEEAPIVTGKVERYGTAVTVPPDMALTTAVQVLNQQIEAEEQTVARGITFPQHPFVVADAFTEAVKEVAGHAIGKGKSHWLFGDSPPQQVEVEVAPGVTKSIIWGDMVFPFDHSGSLNTGYQHTPNGPVGLVQGQFKQKYVHIWDKIIKQTRINLDTRSLFKGRVLRVKFDNAFASVEPWDVGKLDISHIVFRSDLAQQIEDSVITPIEHYAECKKAGIPFKRGILLAGPYGTGKTLLAGSVAKLAATHGMTVIYIERVEWLPQALRMAAQLAPAIVFAEDIDRLTSGERDEQIDTILNTLDGVDTKGAEIMTILTTNYPDKIYKGMIRPGRIDVALEISPPDSEAAQQLVKSYLADAFDSSNGNLEEMGNALAGQIPAVIREVCERSKLSYISRTGSVPSKNSITPDDVLRASGSMQNQIELLQEKKPEPTFEENLASWLTNIGDRLESIENLADNTYSHITD